MRPSGQRSFWVLAGLLAGVVSGCQDAGGDPTALLTGDDVHPAVALAAELPSLPGLATRARVEPLTSAAIDGWIGSWTMPAREGEAARLRAYGEASGPLADALGADGIAQALARLDATVDAAGRLPSETLPPAVAEQLASARAQAEGARDALAAGDLRAAVQATLHGADLLRAVGPEGVARTLVARAEGGLAWAGTPADPVALGRAERLVHGARQAVATGDYGLAIQRAYYACQLLGLAQ